MFVREIDGKEYTFMITRRGLREAEKQGFRLDDIESKPLSALYYLWFAALYAKHPMSMVKSDTLLDSYLDAPDCEEGMDSLLGLLGDEFSSVFGAAVE